MWRKLFAYAAEVERRCTEIAHLAGVDRDAVGLAAERLQDEIDEATYAPEILATLDHWHRQAARGEFRLPNA